MQNNTTLENLLTRWAELEPERCDVNGILGIGMSVAIGGVWAPLRFSDFREYIVLGAVIEAIEARGWVWDLGTAPPRRGGNYPDCMHAAGVFRVRGDMDHNACGPTPAAALLSAYLQPLEALTHAG